MTATHMKIKLAYIGFVLLLLSCQQDDEFNCSNNEPERNNSSVTINQGLWGDIWFWQGDFMPICASGTISPVERTVYVYELTTNDEAELNYASGGFFTSINTNLIGTTTSNSRGFFEIELEPGTYSVFVKEGDNYYANRWTSEGINPVTVTENEVSELLFDITYEATY
jgi:hypothetical protein